LCRVTLFLAYLNSTLAAQVFFCARCAVPPKSRFIVHDHVKPVNQSKLRMMRGCSRMISEQNRTEPGQRTWQLLRRNFWGCPSAGNAARESDARVAASRMLAGYWRGHSLGYDRPADIRTNQTVRPRYRKLLVKRRRCMLRRGLREPRQQTFRVTTQQGLRHSLGTRRVV